MQAYASACECMRSHQLYADHDKENEKDNVSVNVNASISKFSTRGKPSNC